MKVSYLDCCSATDLEAVKVILDTNRETEALCRCKHCRQYWFHRFLEIMKFDGPDDQTTWYSRVTAEEAEIIMGAAGRPDLAFLTSKPTIVKDDRGLRRVWGQPDKPLYG